MRVCFFGGSVVNGTGDDDCLGWPGRLCAEARSRGHDVTLYNLGVRRDTAADVAARWEREAASRLLPEYDGRLAFSFGVNDCVLEDGRRRVPEAAFLANVRTVLTRARATWPTLMVGPPPTGDERARRLSAGLETLCRELSVPFLPVLDRFGGAEPWHIEARQGDGIHPNRGGYALLCRFVLAWKA